MNHKSKIMVWNKLEKNSKNIRNTKEQKPGLYKISPYLSKNMLKDFNRLFYLFFFSRFHILSYFLLSSPHFYFHFTLSIYTNWHFIYAIFLLKFVFFKLHFMTQPFRKYFEYFSVFVSNCYFKFIIPTLEMTKNFLRESIKMCLWN